MASVTGTSEESPPTTIPASRVPPMAWWVLIVAMMFYAMSIVDRQIITLLVEQIKADLGLSDTQMSLILGPAFYLSFSLFGLPAGWVADRVSRRLVLYLGVTIWSISAAGSGLAGGFLLLFLCRAGVGAGESVLSPASYSLLADHFPRNRLAFAIGIYQSSLKLGTAIAFGLGAYLIHVAGDLTRDTSWLNQLETWQLVLILTGAPGVLLAPLIFTVTETSQKRPVAERVDDRGLWTFVRSHAKVLLLLSLGFGCISATSGALTSWTPAYMERHFGWLPTQSGPWLGALSLVTAAALIFKGGVMDWFYNRGMRDVHVRLYHWLTLGAFPFVVVIFMIPSPEIFLVVYGILQILTLTFMGFLAPALQILTPHHLRGQVVALFLLVFAVFGSIGPVFVGMITDYVLKDELRLGTSMSIVVTTFILANIILLRLALSRLHPLLSAAGEAQPQSAPPKS
ncbi:MFS transporter [Phenylobacterium sp.]|uniref:MFS transporter n=1 Tax=Phenylobacterium sp. TaxID=1871053 RepID=UPI0028A0F7F3|nr:MFS transporter [Phenylobacterium sp.]